MEQAELDELRKQFAKVVRTTFPPDAPIADITVLQYGDDPEIEPGQLLGRVVVDAQGATDEDGKEERGRKLEEFHNAHRDALRELRRHMDRLPFRAILEFTLSGESSDDRHHGPKIRLGGGPGGLGGPGGPGPFTPVMARLAQEDLETLDMLITTGIASSRAEAVRWALARIRERPAYEQLRARTREIEELKSQF
jgi:hypothetical protein